MSEEAKKPKKGWFGRGKEEKEPASESLPPDGGEPMDMPPQPADAPQEAAEKAGSVADDLSSHEAATAPAATSRPVAETAAKPGIDLSTFSPEQIEALRAAADIALGKSTRNKKERPTVIELRSIDDKIIVGFSKAFKKSVFDEALQRNTERTYIRVQLEGEEGMREIAYKAFNEAARVKTELVRAETSVYEDEKPEHWSEWKQQFIPQIVTYTRRTLHLKLPNGREIAIDSESVN